MRCASACRRESLFVRTRDCALYTCSLPCHVAPLRTWLAMPQQQLAVVRRSDACGADTDGDQARLCCERVGGVRRRRAQYRAALQWLPSPAGAPQLRLACLCNKLADKLQSSARAPRPAQQVGRVLRVPKRAAGRPDACSDAAHARLERQLWEHLPEYARAAHDAHKSWLFSANVLLPLLGERGAAAGTLVVLPTESARALSCSAAGGVAVDTDEDGRCVCVLLPDHSRFSWQLSSFASPVVTVELKPKCGFLPEVLPAKHCAKRFVTRFEMHQRLKLSCGQVPKARASSARAQPRLASCLMRPLIPAESLLSAGSFFARAGTHARSASCSSRCAAEQLDRPRGRQASVWRCWLLWQSPPGERLRPRHFPQCKVANTPPNRILCPTAGRCGTSEQRIGAFCPRGSHAWRARRHAAAACHRRAAAAQCASQAACCAEARHT